MAMLLQGHPMTHPTPKEFDALLRSDFGVFVEKSFETLNPSIPFLSNWHIDALNHRAQRIKDQTCNRLIINLPPRTLKSMIFSVALPAYLLGKDPTRRIICASYSDTIAVKLANDFRSLLNAPWYARAFGVPDLTKDTETETTTSVGGFRLTTSVGGSLTGRGGNLIIIDDPLNASDAASKASRDRVNDWFRTSVLSRLDDPKRGAIIVVMQRLHVEDLSGILLANGGWTHLCLPAIAPEDMEVTYA
jgi:hypothetical protein